MASTKTILAAIRIARTNLDLARINGQEKSITSNKRLIAKLGLLYDISLMGLTTAKA